LSKHYIKYPIAFNKETKKLVYISNVVNDDKNDLICLECKESFIAILKHQTPHFKHKPNSKCIGNVESYIHWVTKEVFKEIKEIEVPRIFKDNLTNSQRKKIDNQVNSLIEEHVPKNLHLKFRKNLKKNISESRTLKIENIETEKEFKTTIGNIRVDIVATISNQQLFIEPFYTNPIDETKKGKITHLKTPTLSINLLSFISKFNYSYSLEDLKKFLISKRSKTWVFNRENKIEKYIKEYIKYVLEKIEEEQNEFNKNFSKLERITELKKKVEKLEDQIRPTQNEIGKTRDEIRKINNEIGIIDYRY
jgi:hypothetical protein